MIYIWTGVRLQIYLAGSVFARSSKLTPAPYEKGARKYGMLEAHAARSDINGLYAYICGMRTIHSLPQSRRGNITPLFPLQSRSFVAIMEY